MVIELRRFLEVGSRVDHYLLLNIVNQSEANFMASDWIKYR